MQFQKLFSLLSKRQKKKFHSELILTSFNVFIQIPVEGVFFSCSLRLDVGQALWENSKRH